MGGDSHPFQIGEDPTKFGVPLHLPFVHRVVRIEEEGIRHGEGGDGGADSDEEGVDVGDEDDGTLVGDGVLPADGREGPPLLKVEGCVGVGDEAVSLGVGAGAHDDPAEHGVAAVPDLRLDGRTPAPLGEIGVFRAPVLHGIIEDRAGNAGAGPEKTSDGVS